MTERNAPCPCGSGRKYKHCHGRPGARTPVPAATGAATAQRNLEEARRLQAAGDIDRAERLARQLPPGLPRLQLQVGLYLQRAAEGDLERVGRLLDEWERADRRAAEPFYRRIDWSLRRGDAQAAKAAWRRARERAPEAPVTWWYRGLLSQLSGSLDEALGAFTEAVQRASEEPLSRHQLRVEAANEALEVAAGEHPGSTRRDEVALVDESDVLEELRAALESWATHRERTPTAPERQRFANAWYNLGCVAFADFDRIADGLECFERAWNIESGHLLARLNHAFMLNYSDRHDADALASVHRSAGDWLRQRTGPAATGFPNRIEPERRLRVGYLSSDFRAHSVVHFILPVLLKHDRVAIEIVAYHNHEREDDDTGRVRRTVDRFHNVAALDDDALLRRIRDDRIDILVDLNGLSRGHRASLLARRAAPVQGTWIGYPNTTGIDSVDIRIVDGLTDPAGAGDDRHSERLARVEAPFSAYRPPPELPEPAAGLPAGDDGPITFGSFNHLPKLSPSVIDCWARILAALPDARLVVKSIPLGQHAPRQRLLAAFADRGIDAARIVPRGRIVDKSEHMAVYREIDLCLDSFPYNGTTTTCDALVMGVPVLTLAGDEHRSRVSASQLTVLGLDELVTTSPDEYVGRAIELAGDRGLLRRLRSGLRERMMASSLTDGARMARQVEAVYREAWRRWCAAQRAS